MSDRTSIALVVSNIVLMAAIVALVVTLLARPLGGQPSPPEPAPPEILLDAVRQAGLAENWNVTVREVGERLPLWRFSVQLYAAGNNLLLLTPIMLVQTGNLWISGDGIYLNFTDADADGHLSAGDEFDIENLYGGQMFTLRILWAAYQSQIQHATFRT